MSVIITVIEFPAFLSQIGHCISNAERDDLIDFLARQPDAGDEIPGTRGVRKLRWSAKAKGKRGGVRVIYYYFNETAPVFLLTVYGKNVQEDLTPMQKSKVAMLAKILKAQCKSLRKNYND